MKLLYIALALLSTNLYAKTVKEPTCTKMEIIDLETELGPLYKFEGHLYLPVLFRHSDQCTCRRFDIEESFEDDLPLQEDILCD